MNMPATQSNVFAVKENIQSVSNVWNTLYKVYARIEIDKSKGSAIIEIIDGYLNEGEELCVSSINSFAPSKTKVLFVDVLQKSKKNTYLKTNSFDFNPHNHHQILVCVKKGNQLLGYQFMDIENNLLGEPKLDPSDLSFTKKG